MAENPLDALKRRDLERHLLEHGVRLLREGGNHSFWGFDPDGVARSS